MNDFLTSLGSIVGTTNIRTNEAAQPYHTDERNRYHHAPIAVVLPKNTAEVAEVVKLCVAQNPPIAIIPQGGNTGLVGGAAVLPDHPSVLLNLTRVNAVRQIDEANRTMTVEAGVTLEHAQQIAQEHGLLYPLSLASEGTATIGGNLATNAGGTQVLRYGNTRDLCLGLEVVLPNGDIWSGLNTLRKNNTGYDLKHLFIGAEGTLGIITAAVLKLFPSPVDTLTAFIATKDLHHIVQAFNTCQKQFDAQLTAFEYISPNALNLVCDQFNHQHPFADDTQAHVALIEISHTSTQTDALNALHQSFNHHISAAIEQGFIKNAIVAQSGTQQMQFWQIREQISAAQKRVGKNIKHDISVPISAIANFVEVTCSQLEQHYPSIEPTIFGHIGDGNLHFNVSRGQAFANANALMAAETDINQIVYNQVQQHKGSISAEHGIGLLKKDWLEQLKSPVELNLMRVIKQSLDPLNMINPGKILNQ
ncbi:oxidoreductase [Formosimonas limnophila]|uniref:Oxidoreductase n=1 Tax=Formosimonas limnophila TaxID=1384487 RepID=A0A8J3CMQ4_9BURK|nr:FAD-binding oxidoreductase [Formosimonas limnophila]GHA68227.1 oxidoreductase [Formosimonas limnophila]